MRLLSNFQTMCFMVFFVCKRCSIFVHQDAVKTSNMSERKISWIFFWHHFASSCVPIKSLPHFSLQKRENCVLLTLILACWFALILPCKKRFSGTRNTKKSLLKEEEKSCSPPVFDVFFK